MTEFENSARKLSVAAFRVELFESFVYFQECKKLGVNRKTRLRKINVRLESKLGWDELLIWLCTQFSEQVNFSLSRS